MKKLLIGAALGLAACSSPEPAEPDDGALAIGQLEGSGAEQAGARDAVAASNPAVKVTVDQLVAAFEANEVGAMQDYGGVPVQLTGTVRRVVLDFADDPAVLFETGQTRPVQALFDKRAGASTGSLKKGQQATVVCNEVREIMGLPILEDCRMANAVDS
ncbi:hypothetical protein EAO27_13325 [Sphingopyxis sp. YF1]|uniref:OB-fold putative lipoprotein n=1 Tax=Sphingopyxis sp. YF1 TaxID=2482763 RepID=UPI001F6252C0|nr:OB-fold putative lipoprotein [Sphingopyxis sp. YF1]UNU43589.1 hypothetical protein EAO27_13325 [Sphingopyxis sp. YF1]